LSFLRIDATHKRHHRRSTEHLDSITTLQQELKGLVNVVNDHHSSIQYVIGQMVNSTLVFDLHRQALADHHKTGPGAHWRDIALLTLCLLLGLFFFVFIMWKWGFRLMGCCIHNIDEHYVNQPFHLPTLSAAIAPVHPSREQRRQDSTG